MSPLLGAHSGRAKPDSDGAKLDGDAAKPDGGAKPDGSPPRDAARRPVRRARAPLQRRPKADGNALVALAGRLPRPAPVVALAAVVAVAVVALVATCSPFSGVGSSGDAAYVSPYSWDGLARDESGRLTYSEDGQVVSRVGIDVSDHQGEIDWTAVAADGIEFAFVRIGYRGYTEGGLTADERYAENLDGAAAAGLDVGAYFFSQAVTVEEAQEEADFVLSLVAGRYLAYPIAFDHEPVDEEGGRANDLDDATVSACAQAFCERIEAGGYSTMIYGNASDIARYDAAVTDGRAVWFAEYDVAVPTAQFDFSIWQYDNGGAVAGIATAVDLNLLFETAPVTVK